MSYSYTPYYYNGYTPMQYYQPYQYPVMKGLKILIEPIIFYRSDVYS